MYIRIQDQSIRFRLSKDDAVKLLAGDIFCHSLTLSVDSKLVYQVIINESENYFEYSERENKMTLHIYREHLINEVSKCPSKKGIVFEKLIGDKIISIALEIDLKRKSKQKLIN